MNRYLIVVPITKAYYDEGETLIRSLLEHNPDIPVDIITINDEAAGLKEYPNVRQVINEPPCDTEFRRVRTSRFRHAAEVKDEFDVVCLMDADMVTVRPIRNLFQMAEAGTILVGSNNTILRYMKKDFDLMQVSVNPGINVVHGSFCTVPLFLNPTIHSAFLLAVWNSPTGNDLDVPNLLALAMCLQNQLFHLPSYIVLNIHHSMVKPETFIKQTGQGLYSHQGEPVYMLHGHLGNPAYVAELLEPMKKNYGWHPPYVECARSCIQTLAMEYAKYRRPQ